MDFKCTPLLTPVVFLPRNNNKQQDIFISFHYLLFLLSVCSNFLTFLKLISTYISSTAFAIARDCLLALSSYLYMLFVLHTPFTASEVPCTASAHANVFEKECVRQLMNQERVKNRTSLMKRLQHINDRYNF